MQQYFWDGAHWNVEEAYKAFGPNMKTIYNLEELQDYKGRIWVVSSDNYSLGNTVAEELDADIIQQDEFITEYKGYRYTFCLLETEK